MEDNMTIFKLIINGTVPSLKIYEDDKYIAFLDINPKQNGHTLLVPKEQKDNILVDTKEIRESILEITKLISLNLKDKLGADSFKIVMNCGQEAGQEVFHTHLHIIPYYKTKQTLTEVEEIYKIIVNKKNMA